MINKIINCLENKKIAILGFGREGKSTLNFVLKYLPNQEVTIIDKNSNIEKLANSKIHYLLGDNYLGFLNDFDLVIKTPGISLVDKDYQCEITSEFALFLENSESFTIGITGTKGKSTTTSLIYKIIKEQNDNTFLVGNIGIPLFDYIEDFNKDSIIVAEMSAHQLYDLKKSPNISVITNLFEEHLDYFHTLDNYYNSKLNIFRYQNEKDYAIYLEDNMELNQRVKKLNLNSHVIALSGKNIVDNYIVLDGEKIFDLSKNKKILGYYNDLNIMMALQVAKILGLNLENASKSTREFDGLDHRMKLVRVINKRSFYDDTLATIPAASINSIKSIPNVKTIILGGMDRNINYDDFIDYLRVSNLRTIICQPDTGKYIYNKLKNLDNKNVLFIEDLKEAVKKAYEMTNEEESILLSPAAPSYNVYKDYADKSAHYLDFIKDLD